jgi:transcription antitermination protein NusB
MLGRRQIRGKVMQSLYAFYLSNNREEVVESYMKKGMDDIFNLYIHLLMLIIEIKNEAVSQLEIRKKKHLATTEDKQGNKKFVENRIFSILSSNNQLKNYIEKNSQLKWVENSHFPLKILKEIQQSEWFENYMNEGSSSFEKDKELFLEMYSQIIAPSDLLEEIVEEKNIHWSDDLHIANSMVYATIESFREHSGATLNLLRVYKDEEDKEFATSLFKESIAREIEVRKIIERISENWGLDRIAFLDLVILQMAVCEIKYFQTIPHKVSINEYVELAKNYSTLKSKIFINGILDKLIKEIENNNN